MRQALVKLIGMAVYYAIWVPAVIVAHVAGVLLLLYSAEKVSGVLSRTWAQFFGRRRLGDISVVPSHTFTARARHREGSSRPLHLDAQPGPGLDEEVEATEAGRKMSTWARGCNCLVSSQPSTLSSTREPASYLSVCQALPHVLGSVSLQHSKSPCM